MWTAAYPEWPWTCALLAGWACRELSWRGSTQWSCGSDLSPLYTRLCADSDTSATIKMVIMVYFARYLFFCFDTQLLSD